MVCIHLSLVLHLSKSSISSSQPHSRMNMYQKADDRKSHLMLNLLSWVDFLEPEVCVFENVRGFLSYSLNSVQASRYTVKGGIPMGGVKFVVRALVAMGSVQLFD